VQLVFRAWNQWGIFPQTFLQKIEDVFQKGEGGTETNNNAAAASSNTNATASAL
jgi:hypothetical protein